MIFYQVRGCLGGMSMKKIVFSSVILSIMMLSLSCSMRPHQASFDKNIGDDVILDKIKLKVYKEKKELLSHVEINAANGTVVLRGTLQDQDYMDKVIEIAEQQAGVKEVKSFMILTDREHLLKKEELAIRLQSKHN